jgi:hypothetical protein
MTANRKVVKEDGVSPASVFDDGAGRVDLSGIVDPGLTLDVSQADMDAVLTDPLHRIDLNEPSVYDPALPGVVTTTRTFKNVTSRAAVYKVSVASDLPGGISVFPSVLVIPPGGTGKLRITLNGTTGTVGKFYSGQIDLAQVGGQHHLHLPVAFAPSNAATAPAVTVQSSCAPASIKRLQSTVCTATVQNNSLDVAQASAAMSWTNNLQLLSVGAGGSRTLRGAKFGPVSLAAAQPPKPAVAPGASPAGYLDLTDFGVGLQPIGDETITNFNVPGFVYDGQTYTSLGIVSDGYLVVGGGDNNDVNFAPQSFPDTARPNNVLAPFWTDLDGGNGTIAGQGVRIGTLTDGVNSWIVVQWNVHVYGLDNQVETFQAWIGTNGTQDISFAYDPAHPITDPVGQSYNVGAENADGTAGNNVPGLPASDLVVTSTPGAPGGSASFSVTLRGLLPGTGTVETDVTSSVTRDTAVSRTTVSITR